MNYYIVSGVVATALGFFLAAITWNTTNLSADITINALFVIAVMFLLTDSIIKEVKKGC